MADNTKIEWCDHTFNPWEGCTKVSPGCDHCYAATRNARFNGAAVNWGPGAPRRRTSAANWAKPRAWNRNAEAFAKIHGRKQRVFCPSLADAFDNEVDPVWRLDLFNMIDETPMLDWLLLTKRIGNVAWMLAELGRTCLPPNVWLGATVVNQAEADRDTPKLLNVGAAVRFLSIEPMLGPVDLNDIAIGKRSNGVRVDALTGCEWDDLGGRIDGPGLDWVICGGESGPGARPMHPDWARSLRDQCAAAGVPFLFKQWGEWGHAFHLERCHGVAAATTGTGHWPDPKRYRVVGGPLDGKSFESHHSDHLLLRIGKTRAGRLLDGREHNAFPGSN